MFPLEGKRAPIPDGFSITSILPPQMPDKIHHVTSVLPSQEKVKALVGINISFSFLFKVSMNLLYSMINSLQITAHLPLNNITFTANARKTFQYLIDIVSFDLFDVKNFIDFGFTETDPWSSGFDLLDFESCNFIENLGSISIFILLFVVWIGFSAIWFILQI